MVTRGKGATTLPLTSEWAFGFPYIPIYYIFPEIELMFISYAMRYIVIIHASLVMLVVAYIYIYTYAYWVLWTHM